MFRSLRPASVKTISISDGLSPEVMRIGSSMCWVRIVSLSASRNLNSLLSSSLVVLQSSQLIDGKFVSPKITVYSFTYFSHSTLIDWQRQSLFLSVEFGLS